MLGKKKISKYLGFSGIVSFIAIVALILLWILKDKANLSFGTMMILTGLALLIVSLQIFNIEKKKKNYLDEKTLENVRKQIDKNDINDSKGF